VQSYLGVTEPDATPLESTVEELSPYVGVYDAPLTALELSLLEGVLMAQVTPKGGFPRPDSPAPPRRLPDASLSTRPIARLRWTRRSKEQESSFCAIPTAALPGSASAVVSIVACRGIA